MNCDSPYMLFVSDVMINKRRSMTKDEKALFGINKLNVKKSEIPAVTHVDYSARISSSVPIKQLNASSGVLTMGSPLTLNEVFTNIGHPVFFLNSDNNL